MEVFSEKVGEHLKQVCLLNVELQNTVVPTMPNDILFTIYLLLETPCVNLFDHVRTTYFVNRPRTQSSAALRHPMIWQSSLELAWTILQWKSSCSVTDDGQTRIARGSYAVHMIIPVYQSSCTIGQSPTRCPQSTKLCNQPALLPRGEHATAKPRYSRWILNKQTVYSGHLPPAPVLFNY